jgi:hypothetical protein
MTDCCRVSLRVVERQDTVNSGDVGPGPRARLTVSSHSRYRDPGLPVTRFEADPPMRQGKDFDVDELRERFQDFLSEVVSGR